MCEPVTIGALVISGTAQVMAGIAAAGAIAGTISARQKAQSTADAAAKQREVQAGQIADKAGVTIGERVKAARAERARLRVAAGEAGVSGQSFEAQLADSAFQENEDVANIQHDAQNQQDAGQARTDAITASTKQPSLLASGLQIAGAAVGGAAGTAGGITKAGP